MNHCEAEDSAGSWIEVSSTEGSSQASSVHTCPSSDVLCELQASGLEETNLNEEPGLGPRLHPLCDTRRNLAESADLRNLGSRRMVLQEPGIPTSTRVMSEQSPDGSILTGQPLRTRSSSSLLDESSSFTNHPQDLKSTANTDSSCNNAMNFSTNTQATFVPPIHVFSRPFPTSNLAHSRKNIRHNLEHKDNPESLRNYKHEFFQQRSCEARRQSSHLRPARNNVRAAMERLPRTKDSTSHHDFALRSSLSTLLSCAAAAKSLSPEHKPQNNHPDHLNKQIADAAVPNQPLSFRINDDASRKSESIHETGRSSSEDSTKASMKRTNPILQSDETMTLIEEDPDQSSKSHGMLSSRQARISQLLQERKLSPCSSKTRASDLSRESRKRSILSLASATSSSSVISASTSSHASNESSLTADLLTWLMNAGIFVFFSAITFSAGYFIGRYLRVADSSTSLITEMAHGKGLVDRGILEQYSSTMLPHALGSKYVGRQNASEMPRKVCGLPWIIS